MLDNSAAGRGKLGWQGDNSSVSSTFFLVYSPKGRPTLRNGAAGQQIGYFTADGSVVGTVQPGGQFGDAAWCRLVILNYMGLIGTDDQFTTLFPMQGLGSGATLPGLTAFTPDRVTALRVPPPHGGTRARRLSRYADAAAPARAWGGRPHFAARFVDSVKCAVQFCHAGAGAARTPWRRIVIELATAGWPRCGVVLPRAGCAAAARACARCRTAPCAGSAQPPYRLIGQAAPDFALRATVRRQRAPLRAPRRGGGLELLEQPLHAVPRAADAC